MKWDRRFLELAELVATWSKDPGTKVGACIVDFQKRIVSVGFNGPPQGVDDTFVDRDQKLRRTIHAEANALHFAHRNVTGCTMYITHPPCAPCAAHIIQRGIREVCFPTPNEEFLERWRVDMDEAMRMFMDAGVRVCWVDKP